MTISSTQSIFTSIHQKDQKTLALLLLVFCSITQALQIIGNDEEVVAGKDVELICRLIGSATVIQVDWMRTTQNMVQTTIFKILRNRNSTPEEVNDLRSRLEFTGNIQQSTGNVLLKKTKLKDAGNYSCRFTLFEGNPVSKSIQLTIQATPVVNVFTVTPLAGKNEVTLATCSADNAYPPAEVSWNASFLGSTVRITSNSTENPDGTSNVTCNLLGLPLREIQQKTVLCLVRHPTLNGQRMINYSINIHYPPDSVKVTILQSPPPSVVFQCQADANPEDVQYRWIRNGVPLSDNRIKVDENQLHFHKLTSDMNGLYDCEVSNIYGSAAGSLHIYVPQSLRHNFFFWIPFSIFLCISMGCIYARCVLKRGRPEITFRFWKRPSEDPTQEQSVQVERLSSQLMSTEESQGGSSEQSAPMKKPVHEEARNLQEKGT